MTDYKNTLAEQFEESHRLENEIMRQLNSINFNDNAKRNNKMSNEIQFYCIVCLTLKARYRWLSRTRRFGVHKSYGTAIWCWCTSYQ